MFVCKRIISLFMVVVMMLSVMSVGMTTASAAETGVVSTGDYPEIKVGETVTVTIDTAYDEAYLKFVPDTDMAICVYSVSVSDTYGYLYDADMNKIVSDDDSGDGNNFKITKSVTAGQTYYIGAKFYSDVTGSFDVVLSQPSEGEQQTSEWEYYVDDDGALEILAYNGSASDLTIPDTIDGHTVTAIGWGAFYGNTNLVSVTIPESVTRIDGDAFCDCSSLENVTIPDGVRELGAGAFAGTSFADVYGVRGITGDCTWVLKNNELIISGNGAMDDVFRRLRDRYNTAPWGEAETEENPIKKLTIAEGVTRIGNNAFPFLYNLESVSLPSSLTEIGEYAFLCCTKVAEIDLLDNLTTIGREAFECCESLTSITIPDSVTETDYYVFSYCSGLTDVVIGNGVPGIDYGMFQDCTSLKNVTIGSGVNWISYSAFNGCSELTSIVIPEGVSYIDGSFVNCNKLKSITIPASAKNIDEHAFGFLCDPDTYEYTKIDGVIIYGYTDTVAEEYAESNGFTFVSLGEVSFDPKDIIYTVNEDGTATVTGYNGYAPRIVIPSVLDGHTVTSISSYALSGCSQLISVTIPDTVTSIGFGAFMGLPYLESVTLGASVAMIADRAFMDCSSLESIHIPGTVTDIGSLAFLDCFSLTSISVDKNNPNYDSRNNCNAIIETKTNKLIAGCKNTIISDTVTRIGKAAFYGCVDLQSIDIPASVTRIDEQAFYDCTSLESISIPDSVTSIGSMAFDNTAWYNDQPNGVIYAGKVAYYVKGECLPVVELKQGTVGVAEYAFSYCDSLTGVFIPESVVCIGAYAFKNCRSLMSVTIPSSVTEIGEKSFGYAYNYEVDDDAPISGFTINGFSGTAAKRYADENGFNFVPLGEVTTGILGDVDDSREVDIVDALILQRRASEIATPYEEWIDLCGDVDGSGEIDIVDALFVQRYASEIATPYPIGEAA